MLASSRLGGLWIRRSPGMSVLGSRQEHALFLSAARNDVIAMQTIRHLLSRIGHVDVHRMDDQRALREAERALRSGALTLVPGWNVDRCQVEHRSDQPEGASSDRASAESSFASPLPVAYASTPIVASPTRLARARDAEADAPSDQSSTPSPAIASSPISLSSVSATFDSCDDAARAALTVANPLSKTHNLEYGGLIYKDPQTGKFGYSGPIQGDETGVAPAQAAIPQGMELVGDYHTHGEYSVFDPQTGKTVRTGDPRKDDYDSDNFSQTDKDGIRADAAKYAGYKGYLGTPSGVFKVYDPARRKASVL